MLLRTDVRNQYLIQEDRRTKNFVYQIKEQRRHDLFVSKKKACFRNLPLHQ